MVTAKVVGTANQVHACFQSLQSLSGMTTFARQGSKSFPHRAIKPFDVGRVEHLPTSRALQKPHCRLQGAVTHLTHHFGEAFMNRVLDHGSNVQT